VPDLLLADVVVLAVLALEATGGKEDRAGSLESDEGGLFAEMGTRA
jgi:hypothetical protein